MTDIVTSALRDVSLHDAWMPAASFAAGAIASAGPCFAPRVIAVAAIDGNGRSEGRLGRGYAFAAGLLVWYVALGALGGWVARVTTLAYHADAVFAVVLAVLGLHGIVFPGRSHRCAPRVPISFGGAFLLGATFGVMGAPCCTPVVLAIASSAAATGTPWYTALAVGCFAAGHLTPLLLASSVSRPISRWMARYALETAVSVVSGALMLALSALYGLMS